MVAEERDRIRNEGSRKLSKNAFEGGSSDEEIEK